MVLSGRGDVATDAHAGYVAGRYRSGVWSDHVPHPATAARLDGVVEGRERAWFDR